jgi:hypothetical protein
MPDLNDYDYAPGPLQLTQGRIDDITLQEDNFDTRSIRDSNFLNDNMEDFGDAESNFDEEFERTRRNFEMLQQHNSRGSGWFFNCLLSLIYVISIKNIRKCL